MDQPNAATLLRAMAATLTDQVLPETTGAAQHAARVVANLCRILEREWGADPSLESGTRAAVAALLGSDEESSAAPEGWAERLDERLRSSDPAFDAEALEVLLADVRRRLDVNRPGYNS